MANLLNAPYIKGEWGVPAKAERLLHIWMILVFLGLPISNSVLQYAGQKSFQEVYGLIYIVIFMVGIWIESLGKNRFPFLAIDILLFVVTVSGLFGIPNQFASNTTAARATIFYTLFLLLRNFSLFIMLPRTMVVTPGRMAEVAEKWLYRGTMILLVATFVYASSKGYTLTGKRFFEEQWLHPNWIAVYCGLVILLAVIGKHLNKFEKYSGLILAIYLELMMQSRAILVALAGAFVVMYFFAVDQNKAKAFLTTLVGGLVAGGVLFALAPILSEFEPIRNMIERTNTTDPTAGRIEMFQYAVEYWKESPIFGYGFNNGFQMDNFIAKYGTETGIVGVVLYFLFLLALLFTSIKVYKRSVDPDIKYIAKLTIAFNSFVFFRSFAEATDLFHLSDIMSNAAFFWSGMTIAGTSTLALKVKETHTAAQTVTEYKIRAKAAESDQVPTS